MTIPGVVGFRRGGLWREFFITFSTYAYVRTFLIKTPNNPPHHQTHHRPAEWGFFSSETQRFSGPGRRGTAGGGMLARFRLYQQFI